MHSCVIQWYSIVYLTYVLFDLQGTCLRWWTAKGKEPANDYARNLCCVYLSHKARAWLDLYLLQLSKRNEGQYWHFTWASIKKLRNLSSECVSAEGSVDCKTCDYPLTRGSIHAQAKVNLELERIPVELSDLISLRIHLWRGLLCLVANSVQFMVLLLMCLTAVCTLLPRLPSQA